MKLYPFQEKALSTVGQRHILAWPTGTGKSFSALALYERYGYPEKKLLVLAPASKANSGDWERDIGIWFEGKEMPDYQVVSYEKFSRNPTTKQIREGKKALWDSMTYDESHYVVFDECHKLKNPQSLTGKACFITARKSAGFVGLSATPTANGYIDMANYFKIFGFVKNLTEFKRRYVNEVKYKGFPEIIGYFSEEELKEYWNRIASKIDKDEVLDLPPLTKVPVEFGTPPEYIKVMKERLMGEKFLDNPSALLHALRQSTSKPKIPWLNDFLEGVSGHTVIFYSYTAEREAILDLIKKNHKGRKVFRQDGEKHEVPSKEKWDSLPERTITLAQYQSGGTGIECTYAHNVVYFSPTYSSIDYEQSIGRTYRNGQKNKVTNYLLCCNKTVERDIWMALRSKRDFSVKIWAENNVDL